LPQAISLLLSSEGAMSGSIALFSASANNTKNTAETPSGIHVPGSPQPTRPAESMPKTSATRAAVTVIAPTTSSRARATRRGS